MLAESVKTKDCPFRNGLHGVSGVNAVNSGAEGPGGNIVNPFRPQPAAGLGGGSPDTVQAKFGFLSQTDNSYLGRREFTGAVNESNLVKFALDFPVFGKP